MTEPYKVGDKYNKLTIIEICRRPVGNQGRKMVVVKCLCDCGNTSITTITALRGGKIKGCGCLRGQINKTHNRTRTPIYKVFYTAKHRCQNKNDKRYGSYGGRGIKFLWKNFSDFFSDMGDRPKGKTLDRIDNNGNYCKENCRWATTSEQMNNMRSNKLLTYNGECHTIAEWAKKLKVSYGSLEIRIIRGWSTERALNTPIRKRG